MPRLHPHDLSLRCLAAPDTPAKRSNGRKTAHFVRRDNLSQQTYFSEAQISVCKTGNAHAQNNNKNNIQI
jgi:hypothetical protein